MVLVISLMGQLPGSSTSILRSTKELERALARGCAHDTLKAHLITTISCTGAVETISFSRLPLDMHTHSMNAPSAPLNCLMEVAWDLPCPALAG